MRPICCLCNKEMTHTKNGVCVRVSQKNNTVVAGDRYNCPDCGAGVVVGRSKPFVMSRYVSDLAWVIN